VIVIYVMGTDGGVRRVTSNSERDELEIDVITPGSETSATGLSSLAPG
jgi:hypothetical protein